MKKKIYAIFAAFSVSVACFAASHVLTVNGSTVDKTVTQISFDGDKVVLHFGDTSESYDMDAVIISFDTSTSGLDEITAYSFNGIVGNQLQVGGLTQGSLVEIYDINGRRVATATATADITNIEVGHLVSGIYLLRNGNNCIKFVKP